METYGGHSTKKSFFPTQSRSFWNVNKNYFDKIGFFLLFLNKEYCFSRKFCKNNLIKVHILKHQTKRELYYRKTLRIINISNVRY